MGSGKNKKPKIKTEPSNSKQPKMASGPSSFYKLKPVWRISDLEMEGPYGWHKIDIQTFEHIRAKLSDFESMTWNQILMDGKKQHHSISPEQITKAAKERLIAIDQDDAAILVSLRLTGTNRVWGILEEGVLRLLWWDPNHEIFPSKKKHT